MTGARGCSGTTSWRGPPKELRPEAAQGNAGAPLREEERVQRDQSVSEMAQEVLLRQAKAVAHSSGYSSEDAREAVSDTEAGRQLRDLAEGEHGPEKAQAWQASVFWERPRNGSCNASVRRFSRALRPKAALLASRAREAPEP